MRWADLLALKRRFLPPRCPACGQRGLETLSEIPEDGGGRIRLSYHHCGRCGEKLKRHYGKWFIPSDQEWKATALKGEYPRPDSNGRPSV